MSETPINEIKMGNFDSGYYRLIREHLEETGKDNDIIESLDSAKKALDLGSGQGNSAIGIKYLSPNLQIIETVDIAMSIWPWVVEELEPTKIIHHKTRINNFLKRNKAKFDLVNIGSVPNHNIKTNQDYTSLTDAFQSKGLVIESGETHLSTQRMQDAFDLVFSAPWNYYPNITRIWRKK